MIGDVAEGGGTDAAFAALKTKAPVIERFGLRGFGAHSNDAEYVEINSIEPRLYLAARPQRRAWRAAAYVPLSFAPGEAYQFDWSHEVVLLSGATVIVKVAHVRLCHSRMLFVRAYPRETQEMVFDAHDRAFALFKGTCGRGIYDNMKTAVETVFVGKARPLQSPLPADVQSLPGRAGRLHAGLGLGEGSGRESSRSGPRAVARRRWLNVDNDRVGDVDEIIEPITELHPLVGLCRPGRGGIAARDHLR